MAEHHWAKEQTTPYVPPPFGRAPGTVPGSMGYNSLLDPHLRDYMTTIPM